MTNQWGLIPLPLGVTFDPAAAASDNQYGLAPLPSGVPFAAPAPEQPIQPADIFGGFIAGWEQSGPAQTLTASLFTNDNAFYASTVSPGAVTLTATRYDNAQAFYAPTAAPGAVTVASPLVENTQAFYGPTIVRGAVVVDAPLVENAQAFYAIAVTGETGLLPSLYVNPQTFYQGAVDVQALLRGEGWIPQVKRKRKWSEEKDERENLRKTILSAIEPVTERQAKVVNVKGKVAVVTKSQAIPIPVPPQFDSQAVARLVISVLEAQGIEAQRVRESEARKQARLAFEQERQRKLRRRRRDEELLMLMG